jgi:hypothetical protein
MRETHSTDVGARTQDLLQGPLKHVRAAALAAALLPLASVAATPALAQETCSGGAVVGDYVWYDANNNGVQDAGEAGIANAVVTFDSGTVGAPDVLTATDASGWYQFVACPGEHRILVQIPNGMQPSPANAGANDALDSDGLADGLGSSVAMFTVGPFDDTIDTIDFGFSMTPVQQPGTKTPQQWKEFPETWPVDEVMVVKVRYTKAQALAIMHMDESDKSVLMFNAIVAAMLNIEAGNDGSCVSKTLMQAQSWLSMFPIGSNVAPSSLAWAKGEKFYRQLDNYNNGMLCAPAAQ